MDGSQRRGFPSRPPRDDLSIARSDLSQDLQAAQETINQRSSPFGTTYGGQSFARSQGPVGQFDPLNRTGTQPVPFDPSLQPAALPPPQAIPTPVQDLDLHESIERTQTAIYALSLITVTVLALLGEFACLYRNICSVGTGVDVSMYASHAFVPIMFLCFGQVLTAYQSSTFLIRGVIRFLRIFSLIFVILVILFSIAEIVAMLAMVDDSERQSTWRAMSSASQNFYDASLSTYTQQYKANIGILAVFQIIAVVLLMGITVALFVLAGKTPEGYIPRYSYEKRKRVLKPASETEMQNLSQSMAPPPLQPAENPVRFQLSEEPARGFPARTDNPLQPQVPEQPHVLAP